MSILAGQSHISKVRVFPEASKSRVGILLTLIPLQAQLF